MTAPTSPGPGPAPLPACNIGHCRYPYGCRAIGHCPFANGDPESGIPGRVEAAEDAELREASVVKEGEPE